MGISNEGYDGRGENGKGSEDKKDEGGKGNGDYEEYGSHPGKYGDKFDGACLPKWLENRDYNGKYKYVSVFGQFAWINQSQV